MSIHSPRPRHAAPNPLRLPLAPTLAAAIVAVAAHVWLQMGGLIAATGGTLLGMRRLFDHDQLGYMSIVANVANGDLADVEPDTLTGVNHYPRLYYSAVGLLARLLGLHPVAAWNLSGALVQVVLVATLAVGAAVLSRRWWAALLAPAPFVLGTLAWTQGGDSWLWPLESHAVLWGPFGVVFSLNGETAGLCLGTAALLAAAVVWLRPTSSRTRTITSLAAAAVVGLTANFQTYSFLTLVYVAVYCLAMVGLVRRRSILAAAVTAGLVVALFVAGPTAAAVLGQLPTLVAGLLPALPGLLALAAGHRWRVLAVLAVAAAAAAPQLIWTASGIVGGDPFLSYRVGSNRDLGVRSWSTLVASLPLGLFVLALGWVAVRRRDTTSGGIVLGLGTVALLLSMNDAWGANAEPYRFWIDVVFVGSAASLVLATHLLRPPDGLERPTSEHTSRRARRARGAGVVAPIAIVVLATASLLVALPDFQRFRSSPDTAELWDPTDPRDVAVADAARSTEELGGGLVAPGPCIDARTMKVDSAAPVAYYHLGMAWPREYEAVDDVMQAWLGGTFDVAAAERADVRWLVTDSACGDGWSSTYASVLAQETVLPYGDGASITLWRLTEGAS